MTEPEIETKEQRRAERKASRLAAKEAEAVSTPPATGPTIRTSVYVGGQSTRNQTPTWTEGDF